MTHIKDVQLKISKSLEIRERKGKNYQMPKFITTPNGFKVRVTKLMKKKEQENSNVGVVTKDIV